jgi:uncharacterized DUF497 family protein
MRFIWDPKKNRANKAKHGVSFELAALVFDDPLAHNVLDPCETEERWITMGLVGGKVMIMVAHTIEEKEGEEWARIISARRATPRERRRYEEQEQ